MKNFLSKYFLAFIFLLNFLSVPDVPAQTVSARNGYSLPVNPADGHKETIIRILLVWAEVTHDTTHPSSVPGYYEGVLPADANTFFEPDLSLVSSTQAYITKYFYDASFGKYIILGDWLDHKIKVANGGNGYTPVYDYFNALMNKPGSANATLFEDRIAGGSNIQDFDQWHIIDPSNENNPKLYLGISKPNIPNHKADAIIILWKNHPYFKDGGHGLTPHSWGTKKDMGTLPNGFTGVDNDAGFVDGGGLNAKLLIVEEFFHALYGGNNWHISGGAGSYSFYEGTSPWGICTQIAGNGMSNVVSAWDRFHLGWENPAKKILTSALDSSGNEVNTEMITWQSFANGSELILRDFVTTGDAVRIKLPHIEWTKDGDVKNQYLWLENHQRAAAHDVSFAEDAPCKSPWSKGIYVQVQVGKDIIEPAHPNVGDNIDELFGQGKFGYNDKRNALGSFMFPLTAEGNWDYKWRDDLAGTPSDCFAKGIGAIPKDKHSKETLPNPFTGFSDVYANYNADHSARVLTSPFWTGLCEVDASSKLICDGSFRGDSEDGFRCYPDPCPQKILSLSTNPAPVPVYTYKSNQAESSYGTQFPGWENRTIWLNGLSIELLEENVNPAKYGPGAVRIKIRFDDYNVEKDVRWCASGNFNTANGGIKLSPNVFNAALPSLNLLKGKTILIDRGKSGTQHIGYEQDADSNWIFTQPTIFTCLPGSYFHLEPKSTVMVDNKSKLVLSAGSKLEIEKGARLIVRNGSTLVLEAGSKLIIKKGGKLRIEKTGKLEDLR